MFVFIERCKKCQRELGTLKRYEYYDFRFRHVHRGWEFCGLRFSDTYMDRSRGPFLERPGNLPGPISVFGVKCFLTEVSQLLLALNTKFSIL